MARDSVYQRTDPWSASVRADPDFEFAAEQTVQHLPDLASYRNGTKGLMEELAHRTASLSAAVASYQKSTVAQVAGQVKLGLMTVLMLLALWPDTN